MTNSRLGDGGGIIFDASCLNCFAVARRLHTLRSLCGDLVPCTTQAVLDELAAGPARDSDFSWLAVQSVDGLNELRALVPYANVLGSGVRNMGEATVLAWAEVHAAVAIIDDEVAKKAGKRQRVEVHGTLWLIVKGLREGVLAEEEARGLVDVLRDTNARFPCDGATLLEWAKARGLIV